MADQFTPTPVKTKTNGDVVVKIVDTAGTNVAGVDSSNNVKTVVNNASGASAVNIQDGGNSITVDGTVAVSNSFALDATLAKLTVAQGAALGANTQALAGGSVTTAAPTYTTGQISPLSLDTAGNLRVSATFVPSGTQDENIKQVNGVTTQTGTGVAGTGTIRVAVASDSSIVLAAGAAVIGALTANQSVNVAQINGVTTLMGNGVTGTGSQRVTIASDNTPFPIKVDQTTPGTTNAVSLAQIGATTVLTGNGTAGAGAQRVTIASDNTAFVVVPAGANGTAVHSVTNPVWTKLTDGTTALGTGSNPLVVTTEGAAAGTLADTGLLTSAALAAGGNATLTAAAVTSGTAKLLEITASSSVRIKVEVQTFVASSPTTKRVFFVEANQAFTYQPRDRDAITFAGAAGNLFQLKITNMDNASAADIYGSIMQENA